MSEFEFTLTYYPHKKSKLRLKAISVNCLARKCAFDYCKCTCHNARESVLYIQKTLIV